MVTLLHSLSKELTTRYLHPFSLAYLILNITKPHSAPVEQVTFSWEEKGSKNIGTNIWRSIEGKKGLYVILVLKVLQ